MGKSLLFVFRHAPYGSALAREGLDALLAAAVYDQEIAVLFINDGVMQLFSGQKPPEGLKNHQRVLSALSLYGVERVYVDRDSLNQRGLSAADLAIEAEPLSAPDSQALLSSFDHLLSF